VDNFTRYERTKKGGVKTLIDGERGRKIKGGIGLGKLWGAGDSESGHKLHHVPIDVSRVLGSESGLPAAKPCTAIRKRRGGRERKGGSKPKKTCKEGREWERKPTLPCSKDALHQASDDKAEEKPE